MSEREKSTVEGQILPTKDLGTGNEQLEPFKTSGESTNHLNTDLQSKFQSLDITDTKLRDESDKNSSDACVGAKAAYICKPVYVNYKQVSAAGDDSVVTLESDTKDVPFIESAVTNQKLKDTLRKRIWDLMEEKDYVKDYPRPCHNKIPHFKRCSQAAEKLSKLQEFRKAKCIKINPSMAQMHLRFLTLKYNKMLLVPSPALETVLFYKLDPSGFSHFWQYKRGSSKAGAAELGEPVTLDSKLQIDLVVVASVVCSRNGVRLGKGMGFAEIEWGILVEMGAVTKDTIVATSVHDSQVVAESDLPVSCLSKHDLPVDIIVTPSKIINVRKRLTKPLGGIYWDLITEERLEQIPILRQLKERKLKETRP